MKEYEKMEEDVRSDTLIKTKPEIQIVKPLHHFTTKLIIPPSDCEMTLHDRFTKLLCKLQKKEIDPGYREINIPNTLIGRLDRIRFAARLAAAPYVRPSNTVFRTRSEYIAEKDALDKDLDEYFRYYHGKMFSKVPHSQREKYRENYRESYRESYDREDLDDDLENYRRQDPRLQDKNEVESVATLDGGDNRDRDFDEDISDN